MSITLIDFISSNDKKILQLDSSMLHFNEAYHSNGCFSNSYSGQFCSDCYYKISAAIGLMHSNKNAGFRRHSNHESHR